MGIRFSVCEDVAIPVSDVLSQCHPGQLLLDLFSYLLFQTSVLNTSELRFVEVYTTLANVILYI